MPRKPLGHAAETTFEIHLALRGQLFFAETMPCERGGKSKKNQRNRCTGLGQAPPLKHRRSHISEAQNLSDTWHTTDVRAARIPCKVADSH